jgi:acyl-CoA thioester hydrolase
LPEPPHHLPDMPNSPFPAPFVCDRFSVLAEWIDLNGHMNVARYLQAFDQAFDEAYERVGLTKAHMEEERGTTFAAEMHITYQRELLLGDPLSITTRLIAYDVKRMHWIQCMYHREKGYLAATNEWLILYVDIGKRRVGRMPAALEANMQAVMAAHAGLPLPPEVGRRIDMNRRPKKDA